MPDQSLSLAREETNSMNDSDPQTDPDVPDELSDSDDDDRNHKHRRRESSRPHSNDKNIPDLSSQRPNKKRNRPPFENGQSQSQMLSDTPFHSRNRNGNFTTMPPRKRANPSFQSGRGRGRGRNQNQNQKQNQWGPPDLRFGSSPLDMMDLAHMVSSNGYGFMPGIGLDPMHQLGLPGPALPAPPIGPMIDLALPRQRCRDFEERGFCLRGDMCPMEHGVNRIVVEDVQSLSQFNLPVSIPNPHPLGMQPDLLPKPGKDPLRQQNGGVSEADVYDPDQPLWNNGRPEPNLTVPSPNPHSDDQVWTNPDPTQSVWGRIGPVSNKAETSRRSVNNNNSNTNNNNLGSKERIKKSDQFNEESGRQRATRTLYVCGIPLKDNRIETLISHFKKFGQIIDVYIPANSEKAFVQFAKREDAEQALRAPDAVMGNRFIKVWWANRDRISDDSSETAAAAGKAYQRPPHQQHPVKNHVAGPQPAGEPSQPSISKAVAVKEGGGAAAMGTSKGTQQAVNGTKGVVATVNPSPPVQKKMESLELLEELRKKQQILARKRDEFKKQLDKLEKQSSFKKGENAGKGQKVDAATDSPKSTTPNPRPLNNPLEKKNPKEPIVSSHISNLNPNSNLNSKQKNRFKLDNRPTQFRILPPLPDDIADVSVLTEHFSTFGQLSSLVVEERETHVAYTTHESAEKAFNSGKSCKGHLLSFSWVSLSPKVPEASRSAPLQSELERSNSLNGGGPVMSEEKIKVSCSVLADKDFIPIADADMAE